MAAYRLPGWISPEQARRGGETTTRSLLFVSWLVDRSARAGFWLVGLCSRDGGGLRLNAFLSSGPCSQQLQDAGREGGPMQLPIGGEGRLSGTVPHTSSMSVP